MRYCMEPSQTIDIPPTRVSLDMDSIRMEKLLRHVPKEEIPSLTDLYSAESLEGFLKEAGEAPMSVVAGGDIMLSGRAKEVITEHGQDYPFEGVLPILKRSAIVLGNLEGPFAQHARKENRNHSYRVNPMLASSLIRAGINVVTLANNHLMDCGRAGVLETLNALTQADIAPLGAGINKDAAHQPVILTAGTHRVGFLGYYWNRRTAATSKLPGSAMDPPAALESDIRRLREQVDRVVVTFHWGVPYERDLEPENRAKARFAIDCGADAIVGHHPHIIQEFEIYRGCPIFYSVGNFAFGSGNSRAEGMLVGFRFEEGRTRVNIYPMYVKNRDPRVNYQPKILKGHGAERILKRLAEISGSCGNFLQIENGWGRLDLPHLGTRRQM